MAKKLQENDIDFTLTMIGDGPLLLEINKMVNQYKLNDKVNVIGALPFNEVRKKMEESEIFLFTSDFNEGWGAVLNEAMSSGCVCIASSSIGSVPFLIENMQNGIIYNDKLNEDLFLKTKLVFDNKVNKKDISLNAYNTMNDLWNAKVASNRLIKLYINIKSFKNTPFIDGPCSKDENLDTNWFNKF